MRYDNYISFFKKATGFEPYPYQIKLAENKDFPQILNIPTGMGKTDAIILSWIWKVGKNQDDVPRRLIYCLPMRSIVEQVYDNLTLQLKNLNLFSDDFEDSEMYHIVKLMAGEDIINWDLYPEDKIIIIGTQEMLISRALNRGYGMSKYRWPMQFSLLNNDCLWVMDEIQLMGNGLYTTMQLQYFREKYGNFGNAKSVWMSATVAKNIETEDFKIDNNRIVSLSDEDLKNDHIKKIREAKKTLEIKDQKSIKKLTKDIEQDFNENKKIIVILNHVQSAVKLYNELMKGDSISAESIVLLHSHFRFDDKNNKIKKALKLSNSREKSIIISTQVIEAGIDVSCDTMYTEPAPLSSLVQRFGRCNRFGETDEGKIVIISHKSDIFEIGNKTDMAWPYSKDDIGDAMNIMEKFNNKVFDPSGLNFDTNIKPRLIRDKDIIELFDTSPDISNQDADVSIYVRNLKSDNVFVFWRDLTQGLENQPLPSMYELCPANISEIYKSTFKRYKYNFLEGAWEDNTKNKNIIPGSLILMDSNSGGYREDIGYSNNSKDKVKPLESSGNDNTGSYSSDRGAQNNYMTLDEHTEKVVDKSRFILNKLSGVVDEGTSNYIERGALWHDAGKAHDAFQARIIKPGNAIYAKAPGDKWKIKLPDSYDENLKLRKYFRHELVSGLLALQNGEDDLVAYLAAAHHGKVRVSISSINGEYVPDSEDILFAKGVWHHDLVRPFNLQELSIATTKIDMSAMQIGSFDKKSWIAMVIQLYRKFGIFKLAYMETIVRCADQRGSMIRKSINSGAVSGNV